MAESKHDKFIRVAEARTNKIIDMIRLLRTALIPQHMNTLMKT